MNSMNLPFKNLEEMIELTGNAVDGLRSSKIGQFSIPVVAPEYTNWRDEQRAWHESVAILDLSHHETDLYISGPDTIRMLSHIAVNKFDNFPVNRAKQICCCNPDGYHIADGILFHLEEDLYRVAGTPLIVNYVQFHAETGGYDVTVEREDNSAHRQGPPRLFMYQVQGPRALELMERVTKGDMPEIKFFHIGNFEINGIPVRALRHGMAGSPGFEIFGDWAHADEIMAVLFEAGEDLGVRKVGGLAYPTTAVESAWMAWPVPAIYDHPDLKPYREWLKAENVEVIGSLGGSFVSDDIKDYYLRPEELGYGRFFDFNHDFIGKEALRKGVENRKREKVTLIWNREDAAEILSSSLLNKEDNAKFMETPWCGYSLYPCDEVLKDDKHVGIAQMTINSANARAFMSLAVVEMEHSAPGTELTLVWGEPDSKRPLVESHTLRKIRVVVAPAPYYEKIIAND
jgi:vanillate/3-O-methylgallate O-demethylase